MWDYFYVLNRKYCPSTGTRFRVPFLFYFDLILPTDLNNESYTTVVWFGSSTHRDCQSQSGGDLFNDAVSNSDYIMSNDRMIDEK